jgi:hypothetical protein
MAPQLDKTVFQEEWNSLGRAKLLLFLVWEPSDFLAVENRTFVKNVLNLSTEDRGRRLKLFSSRGRPGMERADKRREFLDGYGGAHLPTI